MFIISINIKYSGEIYLNMEIVPIIKVNRNPLIEIKKILILRFINDDQNNKTIIIKLTKFVNLK